MEGEEEEEAHKPNSFFPPSSSVRPSPLPPRLQLWELAPKGGGGGGDGGVALCCCSLRLHFHSTVAARLRRKEGKRMEVVGGGEGGGGEPPLPVLLLLLLYHLLLRPSARPMPRRGSPFRKGGGGGGAGGALESGAGHSGGKGGGKDLTGTIDHQPLPPPPLFLRSSQAEPDEESHMLGGGGKGVGAACGGNFFRANNRGIRSSFAGGGFIQSRGLGKYFYDGARPSNCLEVLMRIKMSKKEVDGILFVQHLLKRATSQNMRPSEIAFVHMHTLRVHPCGALESPSTHGSISRAKKIGGCEAGKDSLSEKFNYAPFPPPPVVSGVRSIFARINEFEFNTGSCKNESTIIEVEQGCPIPGDHDVKTSHRKKEERGAI